MPLLVDALPPLYRDLLDAVRARLRAEDRADLADGVLLELWRQRVLSVPPGRG